MTPSIWTGAVASAEQWRGDATGRDMLETVHAGIEQAMVHPLRVTPIRCWCAACGGVRTMDFTWLFGRISTEGAVSLGWTEAGLCRGCGLNSRMRAVVDFVGRMDRGSSVLLAEQVTPSAPVFERMFRSVITCEYLGPDVAPGSIHRRGHDRVRHEDLTRLSLKDGSVDLVVTQDVFEHIPDVDAAFAECRRVLRPGGRLVFTIPFFPESDTTRVLASATPDGIVHHVLPPEVHGNPLGGGSLCFQHFGWDILERLRGSGFASAVAHTYRGAWQGHFHGPSFVFEATI